MAGNKERVKKLQEGIKINESTAAIYLYIAYCCVTYSSSYNIIVEIQFQLRQQTIKPYANKQ